MGRLAIYSDDDVIAAGKQLVAAGFDAWKVTGTRLRKELGGGTPDRLLAAWQAHLRQMATSSIWQDPAISGVIDGLGSLIGPAKLATMLQQLETAAASVAERAVEAELATARLERTEASAMIEQLDTKIAEQAQCISQLSNELSCERQRLAATHEKLGEAHQREVALDSALTEVRAELIKQLRDQAAQRTELLTMMSTLSKRAGQHHDALASVSALITAKFDETAADTRLIATGVADLNANTNGLSTTLQALLMDMSDSTEKAISEVTKLTTMRGDQGDQILEQLVRLGGQLEKDKSWHVGLLRDVENVSTLIERVGGQQEQAESILRAALVMLQTLSEQVHVATTTGLTTKQG